ncbi:MAG: fimbrial assembly protein [Silvibacterium sp.]
MKITLNLASQPYVDLRSVLNRLRMVILILILLAVPLFLLLKSEQKKAQVATARVHAIQNNVGNLQRQQQSYQALMRQPQYAAALTQSSYLNSLFRRKAFSWTATMTDLETVLPEGVQVLSLDPAIMKNGEVVIHLRVNGARDRAIALVQNLEKSRHFASTRLVGETLAQTSNQNSGLEPVSASTAVIFDILADYRPVTSEEKTAEEKSVAEKKQEEPKAATKAGHRTSRNRSAVAAQQKPEAQ